MTDASLPIKGTVDVNIERTREAVSMGIKVGVTLVIAGIVIGMIIAGLWYLTIKVAPAKQIAEVMDETHSISKGISNLVETQVQGILG